MPMGRLGLATSQPIEGDDVLNCLNRKGREGREGRERTTTALL
jgi:hypothetical protein